MSRKSSLLHCNVYGMRVSKVMVSNGNDDGDSCGGGGGKLNDNQLINNGLENPQFAWLGFSLFFFCSAVYIMLIKNH